MKKIIYLICLLTLITPLFAQSPAYINYQAVLRDNDGFPIKDKLVALNISILEGGPEGQQVFTENHFAITSSNGIINLLIGDGQNQVGELLDIEWGKNECWLQVKLDEDGGNDFVLMYSSQLVAVPYAYHAQTATFSENVNDADADPANEIQTLSLVGTTLSISDGNSVELDAGTSLDDDPTNELQDLSSFKEGANVNLSISNGQGTSFSIQDGDSNSSNELQTLSLEDQELSISGGNTINLGDAYNTLWQPAYSWDSTGIYYWGNVYMDTVNMESLLTVQSNNTYKTSIMDREFNMDDNSDMLFSRFKPSGLEFRSNNFLNLSHFTKDSIYFKKRYEGQPEPINSRLEAQGLFVNGEDMSNRFLDTGIELENISNKLSLSNDAFHFSQHVGLNNHILRMKSTGDSLSFYNPNTRRSLWMGTDTEKNHGMIKLYDGSGDINLSLGSHYPLEEGDVPNMGGIQLYTDGLMTAQLESSSSGAFLQIKNLDGQLLTKVGSDEEGKAELLMHAVDGSEKIKMGFDELDQAEISIKGNANILDQDNKLILQNNENGLNLYNQNDNIAISLGKSTGIQAGAGLIICNDASAYKNFYAGNNILDNNLNSGFAGVYNHFGLLKAGMKVTNSIGIMFGQNFTLEGMSGATRGLWQSNAEDDAGLLYLYGPNDLLNVSLEYGEENKNRGAIKIYDENGQARAGLFIRENTGNGELFADVKHFRMDHPEKADKEIWYASLEGPEAGAYVRGTSSLKQGEAFVEFPDHFKMVANMESMTVILTPLHWDTFGLAVIEKNENGFRVKELKGGTGDFSFDWEVKCVRKGFENYEVIKQKNNSAIK